MVVFFTAISGTEHGYNLRRKCNFLVPKPNLSIFKRSFLYLGPKIFNNLPCSIKELKSLNIFCKKAKDWLLSYDNINIPF